LYIGTLLTDVSKVVINDVTVAMVMMPRASLMAPLATAIAAAAAAASLMHPVMLVPVLLLPW